VGSEEAGNDFDAALGFAREALAVDLAHASFRRRGAWSECFRGGISEAMNTP